MKEMPTTEFQTEIRAGTMGGTLLTIMLHMGQEMLHSAVIAATGAIVSFSVSMLLKWVMRRNR